MGRNYSEHAKEMGSKVEAEPLVFFKPSSSLIQNPNEVILPNFSEEVHHEVELFFQVSKDVHQIRKNEVSNFIEGIGIGVDFTARDLQKIAKDGGKPWSLAKGFYQSAPISDVSSQLNFLENFDLELKVNGKTKQKGNTKDMIWGIPDLLVYLSNRFYLNAGDIIFTGTPKGVAKVEKGDRIEAFLNNTKMLDFSLK
ncbi:fumarylacetoacetate hydrolase family protein [Candidatus Kapabacteria bacterium]|nr:fumarylacetoacetate hydrolase family protein [Candidatus Kapabacteria bacterium]